jgi:hypothetical protein
VLYQLSYGPREPAPTSNFQRCPPKVDLRRSTLLLKGD